MNDNSKQTLHIAVAESTEMVRTGITTMLARLTEPRVTITEISSLPALHDLMYMRPPQLIIVNPLFEGRFSARQFKQRHPQSEVPLWALLTHYTDPAILAHYDNSIGIYDSSDNIATLLRNTIAADRSDTDNEGETLSQREREVLVCVAKGMTNREIAATLILSVHTIITHRRNITRKLQIHSASGLAFYALTNGLVSAEDLK
ncbi:MAG: response regulator transcription factor [Bacteroidales bacterium]|nr:response regulator transcription factor [Bacteroidales bacterium]